MCTFCSVVFMWDAQVYTYVSAGLSNFWRKDVLVWNVKKGKTSSLGGNDIVWVLGRHHFEEN